MPSLSWNEIRQHAIQFSREWENVSRERAEAQTFWNEFFSVFGIKRRSVAVFEEPVKSLKKTYNRIDLFWRGKLLAEHKSAGASLDKAESQAFTYIQDLASSGRYDEIPRYIVISDFQNFVLFDLEPEGIQQLPLFRGEKYHKIEFHLKDLEQHIRHFAFILGQKTHVMSEEDPANIKASQIMAKLYDSMKDGNYDSASLERFLVRILFCLFAVEKMLFSSVRSQFDSLPNALNCFSGRSTWTANSFASLSLVPAGVSGWSNIS